MIANWQKDLTKDSKNKKQKKLAFFFQEATKMMNDVRPWNVAEKLVGDVFVPGLTQTSIWPYKYRLLRKRVLAQRPPHVLDGRASDSLFSRVASLQASGASLNGFWANVAHDTGGRMIHACVYQTVGQAVARVMQQQGSEDAVGSHLSPLGQATLHYSLLATSELAVGLCMQPLSAATTFQSVHCRKSSPKKIKSAVGGGGEQLSLSDAWKEVSSRKSRYDGLALRVAHSFAHNAAREVILWGGATLATPDRVMLGEHVVAEPQNAQQRRDYVRRRLVLRWRRIMWFSLLNSVAFNLANVVTAPLALARYRVEAQGSSFRSPIVHTGSPLAVLTQLFSGAAARASIDALQVTVKNDLWSALLDISFSFGLYVAGILAIDRVDAWAPQLMDTLDTLTYIP
jgi:hypothetical protein